MAELSYIRFQGGRWNAGQSCGWLEAGKEGCGLAWNCTFALAPLAVRVPPNSAHLQLINPFIGVQTMCKVKAVNRYVLSRDLKNI